MKSCTAKLVCFGNGGDSVEWGRHCSSSGYGNPDNPHAAAPSEDKVFPDGCPVIDKRPALETKEGFAWVFKGPMVDVDLKDGSRECPQPSELFASAVAENAFGGLLALQADHKLCDDSEPGPLDYVPTSVYVEGWRQRGARIGHYENGEIVWHD